MLTPIGDRVLVKPAPKEEKTESGIFIPDTAKEKPQYGQVVAVGQGRYAGDTLVSFQDMGIEVGAHVMFKKHSFSAEDFKMDGQDFVILESQDILGVLPSASKSKTK
jgi:chaperonin GroES